MCHSMSFGMTSHLSVISWILFSPKIRCPALDASIKSATGLVFETATNVTGFGSWDFMLLRFSAMYMNLVNLIGYGFFHFLLSEYKILYYHRLFLNLLQNLDLYFCYQKGQTFFPYHFEINFQKMYHNNQLPNNYIQQNCF